MVSKFNFIGFRMGLAISLVSTVPEKVWYHQCKSRGAGCSNTNLVNKGGCAKWFDEIGVFIVSKNISNLFCFRLCRPSKNIWESLYHVSRMTLQSRYLSTRAKCRMEAREQMKVSPVLQFEFYHLFRSCRIQSRY